MKLLLDENLPHRLRPLLVSHDVFTVAFMKWNGIENGNLLALAAGDGFDAVVTKDSGIQYEQNATHLPCSVVILGEFKSEAQRSRGMKATSQALIDRLLLPDKNRQPGVACDVVHSSYRTRAR